jgi:ribosome-binding factor A
MQPNRRARLGSVILEELSQVIRTLKDPRIRPITVTRVELTPDAGMATVFVTLLGYDPDAADQRRAMRETIEGLASASGLLRRHIASALTTRTTPALQFKEDRGLANASRVHELLRELDAEKSAEPGETAADAPAAEPKKAKKD